MVKHKWCRRCMDDEIAKHETVCPTCGHDFLWSVGPKGQVWYGEYKASEHTPKPLPGTNDLPMLRECSDTPSDDLQQVQAGDTERVRNTKRKVSKSPRGAPGKARKGKTVQRRVRRKA
jgi:hypothetical protein